VALGIFASGCCSIQVGECKEQESVTACTSPVLVQRAQAFQELLSFFELREEFFFFTKSCGMHQAPTVLYGVVRARAGRAFPCPLIDLRNHQAIAGRRVGLRLHDGEQPYKMRLAMNSVPLYRVRPPARNWQKTWS
jgi:hypothetical protein